MSRTVGIVEEKHRCLFSTSLCNVEWRPTDDPVLSGVTQTCMTKLEGEVIFLKIQLIVRSDLSSFISIVKIIK